MATTVRYSELPFQGEAHWSGHKVSVFLPQGYLTIMVIFSEIIGGL